MSAEPRLRFKFASEEWEFEAIHRLNYRTFVEEIPQHAPNADGRLVDRFHGENVYAICLHGDRLVGMLSARSTRPFSLDQKVPDLDQYLPSGRRVIEVRLLAVEKEYRSGVIFTRLAGLLAHRYRELGYDLALISGTLRQARLYKHLGFVPFGPLIGTEEAPYQPMYLTLETFLEREDVLAPPAEAASRAPVSFLPGPVEIHPAVREAFARAPISHRSERFLADVKVTQRLLCQLTNANHAQLVMGSGTLANELVGAQLTLLDAPGLILVNGEFSERLVDHARRLGLAHAVHRAAWGDPFREDDLRAALAAVPGAKWIWTTHCETSTGLLNDSEMLARVAREADAHLALDCISSLGTMPLDLRGVYLASGASGKGPAAFPGVGIVFHRDVPEPAPTRLPRYLDLGYVASKDGVPFTMNTNLVLALQTALRREDWPRKYTRVAEGARWLRTRLREAGIEPLVPEPYASPAVTTIVLPPEVDGGTVGRDLRAAGFHVSFNSEYLRQRNWMQLCLMGEWADGHLREVTELVIDRVRRS